MTSVNNSMKGKDISATTVIISANKRQVSLSRAHVCARLASLMVINGVSWVLGLHKKTHYQLLADSGFVGAAAYAAALKSIDAASVTLAASWFSVSFSTISVMTHCAS